jgi:hypothetical protein
MSEAELLKFVTKLYEKGYNALDMIQLLEENNFEIDNKKRYELLVAFNKVRKEIRNEKLLLSFVINFTFLDKMVDLTNISFM